ncbi:aldehyde dehydrogenase family protein [bacterium]|nr:MAG: aldehyde dehydrogenase family protein [bacterium]
MSETLLDTEIQQRIETLFQSQLSNAIKIGETSAKERIQKLKTLEQAILSNQENLVDAISKDFHKPSFETLLSEVTTAVSEIRHTIKHLKSWMKPKRIKRFLTIPTLSGEVEYKSKGVCLILSPWNYPFNLAIGPLVSAIAAGNCAIIKPSELTAHTSAIIESIITSVFPENEVAVVQGDAQIASYLTNLPFHHIFFTGSPKVGKLVMEAASKNLTSVTLELGGKSPVIVTKTADIELAAKRILFGKYINGGQTCVAPDYVLVHENQHDALVKALIETAKAFTESSPLEGSSFCKIITQNHTKRLHVILEDAFQKGASVVFGGKIDVENRDASLTIVDNVNPDMLLMQEEIFGPILPIMKFGQFYDALQTVLGLPRPLASYIFTNNEHDVRTYSAAVRTGAVLKNDTIIHFGHPNAPFGGVNNSGFGNTHGWYGFKAFSHEQPVIRNTKNSPIDLFHPPYKRFHIEAIKKVIKWL